MSEESQEPIPEVFLCLLAEIVRVAPDLPDDTGFALPHGVDPEEILRRFQALPDGAGVRSLIAILDTPDLP